MNVSSMHRSRGEIGLTGTLALMAGTLSLVVSCSEREPGPTPSPSLARAAVVDEEELASLWTRRSGVDWPRFLGPEGNSRSPETGLVVPWPPLGPEIVWQRPLGEGYAMGTISQGRYFHFDGWGHQRASDEWKARLMCLHAETGDELWRYEYATAYSDMLQYKNAPRCSPVVDGNRVYIYGVEGGLHCLRADDGALIWKVDTSAKFGVVQNFFGVGSTPVVEGDLLICVVGGSPPDSPGLYESGGNIEGNGSGVVAFDKYTGKVRYAITDELAGYASPQLATIDDRRWCFVFARGGLVAFDPATGKVDFEYPWRASLLESVNASTPVVVGNTVLISECYQVGSSLLAVRPGGYEIFWKDDRRRREKALMTHWNTPIYVDGYVYGCSGRHTQGADLRCVEWKTGKVMWVQRPEFPQRSSLLYVDGHFVNLGEKGLLQLIKVNPLRCEVISQVTLEEDRQQPRPLLMYPCWAAPVLSHGLLYVRGSDRLVCLEVIPDRQGEQDPTLRANEE